MATLNPSGMVLSSEQIRDDRRRRGLCDTCGLEPNQCYEIKKRMGGIYRDRIPLTVPGKVHNGVCLDCHPEGERHQRKKSLVRRRKTKRATTEVPPTTTPRAEPSVRFEPSEGGTRRTLSVPNVRVPSGLAGPPVRPERQRGSRNLSLHLDQSEDDELRPYARSSPAAMAEAQSDSQRQFLQEAYDDRRQRREEAAADQQEEDQQQQEEEEEEYVEEIEYNIFGEPVPVRKKKSKSKSSKNQDQATSPTKNNHEGEAGSGGHNSYDRQARAEQGNSHWGEENFDQQRERSTPRDSRGRHLNHDSSGRDLHRDSSGRDLHRDSSGRDLHRDSSGRDLRHDSSGRDLYGRNDNGPPRNATPYGQNSDRHDSPPNGRGRPRLDDQPRMESLPSLFKGRTNGGEAPAPAGGGEEEEEEMDALALLCAAYAEDHLEEAPKFTPGSEILHGSEPELHLHAMADDLSVMTPDTFFGRGSVASSVASSKVRQTSFRRQTGLTAIAERSSDDSRGERRPMVSHQIREPAAPAEVAGRRSEEGAGSGEHAAASAGNDYAQDMGDYLESSSPHLLTLREIVTQCIEAGADDAAIETVTGALIHDNATSMSTDLALFCLTQLWVLARRSDENKHMIIHEGSNLDSVIEAMQIYRERSAPIQNRACGVLWSLSMDSGDRKHVVQGGGCEAILNAVRAYPHDEELQAMALGALKVLSFDDVGKSALRSRGAPAAVADVMGRHLGSPVIQSEGCVILGNLAVSDGFVAPVDGGAVEAVVNGILNHPDSLEVHEAACFTLMGLASLASNVELIRQNCNTRVALEMAIQKHPDDVGNNVFTLLKRLKFDPQTS